MGTATKKTKVPKGQKVKRTLTFKLTDEQKAKKGEEAGKLNDDLKVAMDKKVVEMKKHTSGINTLEDKINTLLTQINTGSEEREVECVEVKNFEKKKVEYYFDGEVKHSRDLTEEDKQLTFDANKKTNKFQQPTQVLPTEPTDVKTKAIRAVHKEETGKNTAKSVLNA